MGIKLKTYVVLVILIATLGTQSCKNPKSELISYYDEFYNHVLDHQVDSIYNLLNANSQNLVSKLTDEENMNLDSMILIGNQYRLPSFCMNYFLHCLSTGSTKPTRETFFTYLSISDCNLFSFSREYIVEKDHIKIGDESFISIIREEYGSKKRSWLKVDNHKGKRMTIDLIYTLGQCSKKLELIDKNYRKNNNIKTEKELYLLLIDSVVKSNPLSESDINELIRQRKARY